MIVPAGMLGRRPMALPQRHCTGRRDVSVPAERQAIVPIQLPEKGNVAKELHIFLAGSLDLRAWSARTTSIAAPSSRSVAISLRGFQPADGTGIGSKQESGMFTTIGRTKRALLPLIVLGLLVTSCASSRHPGHMPRQYRATAGTGYVKDNKPAIWTSNQFRIAQFREHYSSTKTVEKALESGQRYLPMILPAFEKRGLPPELAYLPMLESMFENRANSGHARGLWQFTKQTAEHMGLRVGSMVDERLNWRKASEAAADYLDSLGQRFDYDWALALAAYNGGPGYIEDEMKRQRRGDFFSLRLRKETAEYVPRFIAMLQVAKEKQLVALR
jgi:hypothetical protein